DLALAVDLTLDDPLLKRGQFAKAAALARRRADEPGTTHVGRGFDRTRRWLRALALYLEEVPTRGALDRNPGLGDLGFFKLVFRMAFFAADVHRGSPLMYSTSSRIPEREVDRHDDPSRR